MLTIDQLKDDEFCLRFADPATKHVSQRMSSGAEDLFFKPILIRVTRDVGEQITTGTQLEKDMTEQTWSDQLARETRELYRQEVGSTGRAECAIDIRLNKRSKKGSKSSSEKASHVAKT